MIPRVENMMVTPTDLEHAEIPRDESFDRNEPEVPTPADDDDAEAEEEIT